MQLRGQNQHQHRGGPEGRQVAGVHLDRILGQQLHQRRLSIPVQLARSTTARVIIQGGRTSGLKLADPEAHRRAADVKDGSNFRNRAPLRRQEDHLGTLAYTPRRLAGHALQFSLFVVGQWSHINHGAPPTVHEQHSEKSAKDLLIPT